MKSAKTKTHKIISALGAFFLLCSCGKNMSLRQVVSASNAAHPTTTDPTTGDASQTLVNTGAGANNWVNANLSPGTGAVTGTQTLTGTQNQNNVNPHQPTGDDLASVDGELDRWSVFDAKEISAFPFLNKSENENGVRSIGFPAATTQPSGFNYVQRSNVIFRAVIQVPHKEWVKGFTSFQLVFKNFLRYNEPGKTSSDLSRQVLCLVDGKICSGQKTTLPDELKNLNPDFWIQGSDPVSTVFSEMAVPRSVACLLDAEKKDLGDLMGTEANVSFDLRDLFNLKSKGKELKDLTQDDINEMMDFLIAHSTVYADSGYRKFRFVMGNQVYADAGKLDIGFERNDDITKDEPALAPDQLKLNHGNDDQLLMNFKYNDSVPAIEESLSTDPHSSVNTQGNTAGAVTIDSDSGSGSDANPDTRLSIDKIFAAQQGITALFGSVETGSMNHPLKDASALFELAKPKLTFATKESKVSDASQLKRLKQLAEVCAKYSEKIDRIEIVGLADQAVSVNPDNLTLSEQRAKTVYDFFNGIKVKINSKGLGSVARSSCTDPKGSCDADRRVDVGVYLKTTQDPDLGQISNDFANAMML